MKEKIKEILTNILTVIMILSVIAFVFTCAFAEVVIPSNIATNICCISITTMILSFCSAMAINLDN